MSVRRRGSKRPTLMPIRTLGDPVLKEPCADVEAFDDQLKALHRDMLETMYDAPGVGLAAPQVGLALRFFVFDAEKGERPGALANPVLSEAEGEAEEDEGCLSIPNMWVPTTRAYRIRVSGQDLGGNPISIVGEDLLARIFQHETDHLNGMLFIDRLPERERRRVLGELSTRELTGSVGSPRPVPERGRGGPSDARPVE